MDKIKLAIAVSTLSLALGACADMRGDDMGSPPPMEPAAGPQSDTGMTEGQMGDMMDSDDQEGTESGAATGGTTQ